MFLRRSRPALILLLALLLLALGAALLAGTRAGAQAPRTPATVALLSLPRGAASVALGPAPQWLPLAGTPETLTLLLGEPRSATERSLNAYVGLLPARRGCAASPARAHTGLITLIRPFSPARLASRPDDPFAPQGGASAATFISSVGRVVVHEQGSVRACVWLAGSPRAGGRRLLTSVLIPLLNHRFGAAVADLTGGRPGSGGVTMTAFTAGAPLRYSASRVSCNTTGRDPVVAVAPSTPATEAVAIPATPCSGDVSSFSFSGPGVHVTLHYPIADALASPPAIVHAGACALDPLTGATLLAARSYLTAVGCRLGRVERSPRVPALPRNSVAWAAVNGGVAELAPPGTAVDLVLNG